MLNTLLPLKNCNSTTSNNINTMGNDVSAMVAKQGAKSQIDDTMKQLGLGGNDDNEGKQKSQKDLSAARREQEQKRKEREEAFKEKQAERAARKGKLSEQWAKHKTENSDAPKKGFFSK